MNLAGNAIKFTQRGHVTMTVECEQQDHETAQMTVSVQDTGIGIAQEKAALLFEKFLQADPSNDAQVRRHGIRIGNF
jgi:signal transduction histidine kinase